jgi:hypothetical protein
MALDDKMCVDEYAVHFELALECVRSAEARARGRGEEPTEGQRAFMHQWKGEGTRVVSRVGTEAWCEAFVWNSIQSKTKGWRRNQPSNCALHAIDRAFLGVNLWFASHAIESQLAHLDPGLVSDNM